jgi:magnesium chelatase subunit D
LNTSPAQLSDPVKKNPLATSTENIQPGKQKGTAWAGQRRSSLSSKKPDWFVTLVKGLGQWPPKKIRYAQRKDGKAILHLMLLDTSSSTLTGQLFSQAKGVILSVSKAAYIKREQMAIIGFGNDTLENILPRVRAPKQIQAQLDNIQAGGGTPMREALLNAQQYIAKLQKQLPSLSVRTYIITDGRTRQNVDDIKLPGETLVLDIEDSVVKRGRGESIAQSLGAHYMTLSRYMNVLEDEQPLKKSLFDNGISRNFSHKGLET